MAMDALASDGPRDSGVTGPALARGVRSHRDLIARHGARLAASGGRLPTPTDLTFTGLTPAQVADALDGVCPLGVTPDQWQELLDAVGVALDDEGVRGAVEVGVAGSAVTFTSRKEFPRSLADLISQARAAKVDDVSVLERWRASPYARMAADELPHHHFFDSSRRLGFGRSSDIDFYIYGVAFEARMRAFQAERQIPDGELIKGGWYKVKYVREAFPELRATMKHWTKALGRPVDFAGPVYTGDSGRPPFVWNLTDRLTT